MQLATDSTGCRLGAAHLCLELRGTCHPILRFLFELTKLPVGWWFMYFYGQLTETSACTNHANRFGPLPRHAGLVHACVREGGGGRWNRTRQRILLGSIRGNESTSGLDLRRRPAACKLWGSKYVLRPVSSKRKPMLRSAEPSPPPPRVGSG